MPLLSDLRGLFQRKKPGAVDLTISQAGDLARKADINVEPKPISKHFGPGSRFNGDAAERRDSNDRTRPASDAAPTGDEIASLIRKISVHLDAQDRRTDRLVECMERLPAALDALPELNRRNAHLFELISDFLTHARERDRAMNETLGGISAATQRHTEVLGLLQQQLDAHNRATESLQMHLGDFRTVLRDLADSTSRATDVLSTFTETSRRRETELLKTLARTQRLTMIAIGCCIAVAATAAGAVSLFLG